MSHFGRGLYLEVNGAMKTILRVLSVATILNLTACGGVGNVGGNSTNNSSSSPTTPTENSGSNNAACTFNGQSVASGASITAYSSSTVAAGQTCVSQGRTCNNGTLSGSYMYATCTGPSTVLWQDNVQTESNWNSMGPGFFPVVQQPIGTNLIGLGADNLGASLSRVRDPAGGPGYALRHYLDPFRGGRAQYSMASWTNPAFGTMAQRGEVWIEWEVYFPVVPSSSGPGAWLSIMDFHSHGPNGEEWWATNGALMFASEALGGTSNDQGRLRMRDTTNTRFSNISTAGIPAGRWVKLQVHYIWSTSEVPITLYIDGVQSMTLRAITKHPVHTQLEFMMKLYGGNVGAGVWAPNPIVYYSRNIKIGSGLIP